jgi:1-phosphofructokinase family hexose kinase
MTITCLGLAPALDITYGVASVAVGRIHRPDWVLELAGGKASNVARALRTLGGEVRLIAPLGGPNGSAVERSLVSENIAATIVRTRENTRRCVTAMDATTGTATEFYEPASPLDDAALSGVLDAVDSLSDGWLAVSGSMPSAIVTQVTEAVARAASRGVRIAADTHGVALRELLARVSPAVVKVNRFEAADLFGQAEAAGLARRVREAADVAVVTDGVAGAAAVSESGAWFARPGEKGRFAVGSGDSFLAGLLRGLTRGDDLRSALALATAAAAANTRAPGAARFTPSDVAAVLPGVDVRPLDEPPISSAR